MGSIKGLEKQAAPLFINLNKLNCREAARNLAREVDKELDAKYSAQRSEAIQAGQIEVMDLFTEEYKKTLAEDWKRNVNKKAELDKKARASEEEAREKNAEEQAELKEKALKEEEKRQKIDADRRKPVVVKKKSKKGKGKKRGKKGRR